MANTHFEPEFLSRHDCHADRPMMAYGNQPTCHRRHLFGTGLSRTVKSRRSEISKPKATVRSAPRCTGAIASQS